MFAGTVTPGAYGALMINDDHHRHPYPLLEALGITLAVSVEPLDRPVWVGTHRILIVGQDVTEDDLLAAAWRVSLQLDPAA